jgi:ElaB/YqjD/DUF883 family membrane-anchored ribosome-binding protein
MTQAKDESTQQEGLASQASAKVQDAASATQEKASELGQQGSVRLREQFDQRSSQAGSQVRSLAEALRRSGNELSNEGNSDASQLTERAADRIERLGAYLEQKSGDELMRDIETFTRRRPWTLAGIGMLAGVAAARITKASSEQRYDSYRQTSQQWPTRSDTGQRQLPTPSGGETGESGVAGSDVPGALSDERLERDRYAGTR